MGNPLKLLLKGADLFSYEPGDETDLSVFRGRLSIQNVIRKNQRKEISPMFSGHAFGGMRWNLLL
jgi:hypothetical protein